MNSKHPKVFVILTLDTLRADRTGFCGYDRPTTPKLDEFSGECVVFENAFSLGPTTSISFPAMMSSSLPLDMKGRRHGFVEGRPYLPEFLAHHGVHTAMIHSHPVLNTSFGYGRGVEDWIDVDPPGGSVLRGRVQKRVALRRRAHQVHDMLTRVPLWESFWKPLGIRLFQMADKLLMRSHYQSWDTPAYAPAEQLTDRAIRWLEESAGRGAPRFLWVHYAEPHAPYFFPREFSSVGPTPCTEEMRRQVNRNFEKWTEDRQLDLSNVPLDVVSSLYDATTAYADREVGRLLDFLRNSAMWDEAAIIVSADHGEEFGEHGSLFHHLKLHREVLNVPLLLRVPGVRPRTISTPVSLLDLCPTVSRCLGVGEHPDWKGGSLLRFGNGESREHATTVISECIRRGSPHIAATGEHFRLIYGGAEQWEAYALHDRREVENLHADLMHNEEVAALKAAIERRLAEVEGTDEQRLEVMDESVKNRLKALGYFE